MKMCQENKAMSCKQPASKQRCSRRPFQLELKTHDVSSGSGEKMLHISPSSSSIAFSTGN